MTTTDFQEKTVRIDAATRALLDEAWESVQRGEVFTEEEVEAELDEIEREWEHNEKVAYPA